VQLTVDYLLNILLRRCVWLTHFAKGNAFYGYRTDEMRTNKRWLCKTLWWLM